MSRCGWHRSGSPTRSRWDRFATSGRRAARRPSAWRLRRDVVRCTGVDDGIAGRGDVEVLLQLGRHVDVDAYLSAIAALPAGLQSQLLQVLLVLLADRGLRSGGVGGLGSLLGAEHV